MPIKNIVYFDMQIYQENKSNSRLIEIPVTERKKLLRYLVCYFKLSGSEVYEETVNELLDYFFKDKIHEDMDLKTGSTVDHYKERRKSLSILDLKICISQCYSAEQLVAISTVWILLVQKFDRIRSF